VSEKHHGYTGKRTWDTHWISGLEHPGACLDVYGKEFSMFSPVSVAWTNLQAKGIKVVMQSSAKFPQTDYLEDNCMPEEIPWTHIVDKYNAFGNSLCTYGRWWKWCRRTIVSKNWIKQLHALPVLHFNRCLTTECSEASHFSGNFDTDNHIYVP
jgi:hypothetical protein